MPSQAPQWTEYLSCPICIKVFNEKDHKPISLGCGHTVCRICLVNLQEKKCPYDSCVITKKIDELPVNYALLQLVGAAIPEDERTEANLVKENSSFYESCKKCIEELAANMKSLTDDESENEDEMLKHLQSNSSHQSSSNSILSRPMQRKLVTLINCQLVEEEGRARAMRAARSLGERTVAELILQHQNPQQLSANLWAAVRARGCQFLGPEMQAEVLKLILLALEDGSALARKVLVLFVVQRLEATFTQASKTAIGHVVQLLYRASCFKVTKRDDTSSLMQLKDEFRTYEALRREHDSQIVQIAMEAGLRISPEQWSSLLYGDPAHKSHMQSIIDKLQTPQSFAQSVNELIIVLQRTSDPGKLHLLQPHFEFLAKIDPSQDKQVPSWENLEAILRALRTVVQSLINYLNNHSHKKSDLLPAQNVRYKTSMCRDFSMNKSCPRSVNCTFAHSEEELERFRSKKKFGTKCYTAVPLASTSLNAKEKEELELVNRSTDCKLDSRNATGTSVLTILTNSSKTNTSIAKSVPMTNVVKPMMAPPATSIVSLTTDTTTSIATSSSITSVSSSNKLLPGAMVQGIPSVSSFPLQSEVSSVYYPPAIPIPPVHHSLMPNAPLSSSAVHHTPMATATPHHLHQTYVRPTGAAARYPTAIQTYPSVLPYQVEAAGACAHNVHGYMCDGQSHGIAQMHGLPQQIGMTHYPCADGSYRMMNPAYRNATTPPPSVGVTPLAVQPTLQPSKNTDQQFSNQELHDLQSRRQEILSQIHNNIQMTPAPRETTVENSRQIHTRQNGSNYEKEKNLQSLMARGNNTGNFGSAKHWNISNGLSQTEKAYTILKKELSRNPTEAPDPRELSWPTPTISVSAVMEFQNQILKAQKKSFWDEDLHSINNAPHEGASTNVNQSKWEDDDDFSVSHSLAEVDLETDGCEFNSSSEYNQWSTYDWTSQNTEEEKSSNGEQYHGTNLFDWFQKPKLNDQDVEVFIPFDPPIVSKFGPISRVSRSKLKNSDPVIVTADKEISKMTPVTAVTPMQRPYPVSAPAPSRYKVPGQKSQITQSSKTTVSEPHTLWHQHTSRPLDNDRRLHQELTRLEHNATGASTPDERLAYELQAIELKISMQTGKRPDLVDPPDIGRIEPPPTSSSLNMLPISTDRQQISTLHRALEAQMERGDELISKRHQEKLDRQLAEKLMMEELQSNRLPHK